MRPLHACVLLALLWLMGLGLAGCGGTSADRVELDQGGIRQVGGGALVRIAQVENATGDPRFDALCHFLHMKAGQVLDQAGYDVLSDDLLASMPVSAMPELIGGEEVAPAYVFELRLRSVREHAGGTLSIAVFSAQGKSVDVEVGARFVTPEGRLVSSAQGRGRADKGAWGMIAEVNREAMLDDQGFWALDNSMTGTAAVRALVQALNRMEPVRER